MANEAELQRMRELGLTNLVEVNDALVAKCKALQDEARAQVAIADARLFDCHRLKEALLEALDIAAKMTPNSGSHRSVWEPTHARIAELRKIAEEP